MTAAVIAGIGGALPSTQVSNDDLARRMDTSDEWIRARTGIGSRYWSDGVSTSDLAVAAGKRALASAGRDAADMVIVATTTPDYHCPATAPAVAARLGLLGVPAFDLAAVCSGFIYALATARSAVISGLAQSVLVIGSETYSTILDHDDRSTAVIFGDGAGAVLVRAGLSSDPGQICGVHLGSDGSETSLICIPGGGSFHSAHPNSNPSPFFMMQGRDVFRSAVQHMVSSSTAVLAASKWAVADVDWVVGHQANRRILQAIADQLGVERSRLVSNLEFVGNTSAASIPLAMLHAALLGQLNGGDKVLLTAFGGGSTWGSASVIWGPIPVEPTISVAAQSLNGDEIDKQGDHSVPGGLDRKPA